MSSQSGGSTLQLGDYLRLAKRRWWAIALGLLVGLSAGYAFTATRSQEYTATASVLVQPVATDTEVVNGRTTGAVNLDTEAQLVRSSKTAQAARDLLRTESDLTTLIERVSVTVPPNTAVLAITYTAPSTGVYEIIVGDGLREPPAGGNADKGAVGQRVWHVRGELKALEASEL